MRVVKKVVMIATMKQTIGLDIGGTKIAAASLSANGALSQEIVIPTPKEYPAFLDACCELVKRIESEVSNKFSVGVSITGAIDRQTGIITPSNLPFLINRPFRDDLEVRLDRKIIIENDANCLALAEAVDGAGAGFNTVLCLIMGTGVGSGFVHDGRLIVGAHGMAGEIGHLPLPCYEESDGPVFPCLCKQKGCIEKLIGGPALERLYTYMTDKKATPREIAAMANNGDADSKRVLDRYYEVVAKAMVTILHSFDPDAIVVSGGLSALTGLYDEVPRRWGKYALVPEPKTKFLKAKHGPMAGLRGAALLARDF